MSSADTPQAGRIFESHPNERQPQAQLCHDRGFHRVNFTKELDSEGYTVHSPCVDCGAPGNDMPMHDAARTAGPKVPDSTVPDGDLGHNPDADFAEMMRAREMGTAEFLKRAKEKREGKDAPSISTGPPIPMTRETVIELCKAYGIALVDPEGISGNAAHMSERLKELQDQNAALLQRAQMAEAAAANAVQELRALKNERSPLRQR